MNGPRSPRPWAERTPSSLRVHRPSCRRCGRQVEAHRPHLQREAVPFCSACHAVERSRSSAQSAYNVSPFRPLPGGLRPYVARTAQQ